MIEADLAVVGIGELVTPTGRAAVTGEALGRVTRIEDAAVAARQGRLVYVGDRAGFEARVKLLPGARTVDADGGTVLPGFVDAHTHIVFDGWRESEFDERLRGSSYSEIAARGGGILSTVTATRAAGLERLTANVSAHLDAMLVQGTTTAEVKSGYGLAADHELTLLQAAARAAADHPVEVVPTFLGAHTLPAERRGDREGYVAEVVDEMLPAVAERGLARYADVFVDEHAFRLEEARRILVAARERGLGIRIHADQLADDGAAALAGELGAASADHLEYASDEGLAKMARAGTCGVLLPAATFFLMMERRPPGRRLIEAGVPVVVATDFNPGSCPTESIPAALWFASLTGGLTVDEAITASTLNAACSLGLGDDRGSLEVGKRADLVIHAIPNRYHLVYRFGVPRVRTVLVGGKVVAERGEAVYRPRP